MADGIRAVVAQARASGDWQPVLDAVPYFQFLGLTVARVDGRLRARMRFSDHLVGNPTLPALHGGTLGALLEVAAQCEALDRIDTFATAEVVRRGRRVATVQARAFQDDAQTPIALATVHLLVRADRERP
jgi:acyl-coenzyme A thioesterase PaaI-like protein